MIYTALDPGISTGVAIKRDDRYYTLTFTLENLDEGKLRELISKSNEIIYEDFVGYSSHQMRVSKDGFETVRIIGRILEICNALQIPVHRRAAQNRLSFLKKAKQMLKAKQVICSSPTRHEADALAHMLSWEHFVLKQREEVKA